MILNTINICNCPCTCKKLFNYNPHFEYYKGKNKYAKYHKKGGDSFPPGLINALACTITAVQEAVPPQILTTLFLLSCLISPYLTDPDKKKRSLRFSVLMKATFEEQNSGMLLSNIGHIRRVKLYPLTFFKHKLEPAVILAGMYNSRYCLNKSSNNENAAS